MRHQLTIRITFDDTDDDVQGRGFALEWLRRHLKIDLPPSEVDLRAALVCGPEIKLHQLRLYGPPKPIKLWEEKHEQTKGKATS